MENINAYEQSNADYQAVQNSSPSGQSVLPAPDFSKPYTYNSETPEKAKTPNQSINSAGEGVGVSPLVMEKKQGDSFAVPTPRKPTYLDGGLNEGANSTPVELPKTTSEGIEKAFTENIDASKIDVPPALEPFSKAADILEKESSKTDTPESKTAAAEEIMKNANDYRLNQYAEYLGKGGTIYVHVINPERNKTRTNIKDKKSSESLIPTKKHYIRAAQIMNQRFYNLDINLKVIVKFSSKPLTKKEFQARKDYNPLDSYVVVDHEYNFLEWEEERKKNGEKAFSEDTWQMLGGGSLGVSAKYEFYSRLSTNYFGSFATDGGQSGGFKYEEAANKYGADEALAMALAKVIEHEVGHSKFDLHPMDDSSKTDFAGNKKSKEMTRGDGGHVSKTIMQSAPMYGDSESYDLYMLCMLRTLHGRVTNGVYDTESLTLNNILEKSVSKITKEDALIILSSRTDILK